MKSYVGSLCIRKWKRAVFWIDSVSLLRACIVYFPLGINNRAG